MGKKKIIDISYANRVKYESFDDFDDSLFSDEYYKASKKVKHIIKLNKEKACGFDKAFCQDEQLNNIIAFLGERGVGKSSAMLSFALFLKDDENRRRTSDYQIDVDDKYAFSILPRIDVAMMVKGERILDVILAKMWDSFENEYRKQSGWRVNSLEEVKEQFRKVKSDYAIYMSTILDKNKITSTSSIEELHNLAAVLNLKEEIKNLVSCYLNCIIKDSKVGTDNQYLVLAIDDLDLAVENVYEILEQIRIFMVIPKVIILLTADISRMMDGGVNSACKNMCSNLFPNNVNERLYSDTRTYMGDYLAKMVPHNMRIGMPAIKQIVDEACIMGSEEIQEFLYEIVNDKTPKLETEKQRIMASVFASTGILFSPKQSRHHYLQGTSLRKVVNSLCELNEILYEKTEKRHTFMLDWLNSKLNKMYLEINSIESVEEQKLIRELYMTDSRYFNEILVKYCIKSKISIFNNSNIVWDYNYGEILLALNVLSEKARNFITLLYSIELTKQFAEKKNDEILIGNGIFKDTIYRENDDEDKNVDWHSEKARVENRLSFRININKSVSSFNDITILIDQNRRNILESFYIANLCNPAFMKYMLMHREEIKIVASTSEYSLDLDELEGESYITIEPIQKTIMTGWNLDNILLNSLNYGDNLQKYISNLLEALCRYYHIDFHYSQLQKIIDIHFGKFIKDYNSWKSVYKIENLNDVLPLNSVELMYKIAVGMNEYSKLQVNNSPIYTFYERLIHRIDHVINELEDAEQYVGVSFMGKKGCSDKIKKYFEVIKIKELSRESIIKINELDNLKSDEIFTDDDIYK